MLHAGCSRSLVRSAPRRRSRLQDRQKWPTKKHHLLPSHYRPSPLRATSRYSPSRHPPHQTQPPASPTDPPTLRHPSPVRPSRSTFPRTAPPHTIDESQSPPRSPSSQDSRGKSATHAAIHRDRKTLNAHADLSSISSPAATLSPATNFPRIPLDARHPSLDAG